MLSPSCRVKGYVSYLLLCAVRKSVVHSGAGDGFWWYMCNDGIETIEMLKGGAETMHGLCSCVGSLHVYLFCNLWI